MKTFAIIICFGLGFVFVRWASGIVNSTGQIRAVDRILGSAGTKVLVRLVGVVLILAGFIILFGGLDFLFVEPAPPVPVAPY